MLSSILPPSSFTFLNPSWVLFFIPVYFLILLISFSVLSGSFLNPSSPRPLTLISNPPSYFLYPLHNTILFAPLPTSLIFSLVYSLLSSSILLPPHSTFPYLFLNPSSFALILSHLPSLPSYSSSFLHRPFPHALLSFPIPFLVCYSPPFLKPFIIYHTYISLLHLPWSPSPLAPKEKRKKKEYRTELYPSTPLLSSRSWILARFFQRTGLAEKLTPPPPTPIPRCHRWWRLAPGLPLAAHWRHSRTLYGGSICYLSPRPPRRICLLHSPWRGCICMHGLAAKTMYVYFVHYSRIIHTCSAP